MSYTPQETRALTYEALTGTGEAMEGSSILDDWPPNSVFWSPDDVGQTIGLLQGLGWEVARIHSRAQVSMRRPGVDLAVAVRGTSDRGGTIVFFYDAEETDREYVETSSLRRLV